MPYYVVQQIIKNEKHLFKIGESKDDDCRCESVRMWSGCFLEQNRVLKKKWS